MPSRIGRAVCGGVQGRQEDMQDVHAPLLRQQAQQGGPAGAQQHEVAKILHKRVDEVRVIGRLKVQQTHAKGIEPIIARVGAHNSYLMQVVDG